MAVSQRYSRVSRRIWRDAKVRNLSAPEPSGRHLWVHLLTMAEERIPGLIPVGAAALAEELEWSPEGFRKAFSELVREGMAKADWKARLVWIPNRIDHDSPANPNVVKSWAQAWDLIPECQLKTQAYQELRGWMKARGGTWLESFEEACGNPLGNPCRKPEPEPEPDPEPDPRPSDDGRSTRATPPAETRAPRPPAKPSSSTSTVPGETDEWVEMVVAAIESRPDLHGLIADARGVAEDTLGIMLTRGSKRHPDGWYLGVIDRVNRYVRSTKQSGDPLKPAKLVDNLKLWLASPNDPDLPKYRGGDDGKESEADHRKRMAAEARQFRAERARQREAALPPTQTREALSSVLGAIGVGPASDGAKGAP